MTLMVDLEAQFGNRPGSTAFEILHDNVILSGTHVRRKATDKHPGGRPLKFQSIKALQQKIDEYWRLRPAHHPPLTNVSNMAVSDS